MNNPGLKNLGDAPLAAINAATAATVITSAPDSQGQSQGHIDGLDGMLGAAISANFVYGSGGDTVKVIVETSMNQGATWIEVARLAFAQVSAEKTVNLSGLTPVTTVYAPAALSDDTVKDGLLGPRWRARILKGAGAAYGGNTALAVRLIAR
ncbi:MAG: hypothetical protein Q8M26_08740 [Pseudolabrys sp.]|nr:hypothetical protein [Pseudolabrys sp.]